jgi:hypothetical protein
MAHCWISVRPLSASRAFFYPRFHDMNVVVFDFGNRRVALAIECAQHEFQRLIDLLSSLGSAAIHCPFDRTGGCGLVLEHLLLVLANFVELRFVPFRRREVVPGLIEPEGLQVRLFVECRKLDLADLVGDSSSSLQGGSKEIADQVPLREPLQLDNLHSINEAR